MAGKHLRAHDGAKTKRNSHTEVTLWVWQSWSNVFRIDEVPFKSNNHLCIACTAKYQHQALLKGRERGGRLLYLCMPCCCSSAGNLFYKSNSIRKEYCCNSPHSHVHGNPTHIHQYLKTWNTVLLAEAQYFDTSYKKLFLSNGKAIPLDFRKVLWFKLMLSMCVLWFPAD